MASVRITVQLTETEARALRAMLGGMSPIEYHKITNSTDHAETLANLYRQLVRVGLVDYED